jgi:probable addiction module antidote protein
MDKKKTSKKRGFSFKNMPAIQIQNTAKISDYSATERLKDKKYVVSALIQCLRDGDADAFKEILRSYLDVINKSKFAAKTHIPQRTLYRMVSESGNPTLDTIARVVHALCA